MHRLGLHDVAPTQSASERSKARTSCWSWLLRPHPVTKPDAQKLDCFRLLAELSAAGVSNSEAARRLDKPISTVRSWKGGAEPLYSDGKRLVELHEYVTIIKHS